MVKTKQSRLLESSTDQIHFIIIGKKKFDVKRMNDNHVSGGKQQLSKISPIYWYIGFLFCDNQCEYKITLT